MAIIPKILDDPEKQARTRENLRADIYKDALPAINKGVDQAVNDVLNNKEGGFMGFIKSMIFKFAKMFGFEKTLAKWFGSPIPEKNEQQIVAAQVSDTVSQALTDDNFTYKNKQEFEQGLNNRILTDLKANRAATPSFNDEQLAKVAQQASTAASNKFAELFDAEGNAAPNLYQSPVSELAGQQFRSKLQENISPDNMQNLAKLGGKEKLQSGDLEIISRVVAPTLADFEMRKGELVAEGGQAFSTVSDELRTVLRNNKEVIKKGSGLDMTNAGLDVVADQIALGYVKELGVDAPQEFVAQT